LIKTLNEMCLEKTTQNKELSDLKRTLHQEKIHTTHLAAKLRIAQAPKTCQEEARLLVSNANPAAVMLMESIISFKNALASAAGDTRSPKKATTRELLHMRNTVLVNHLKLERASDTENPLVFPLLCHNSPQGVASLLKMVGYILYGNDLHNTEGTNIMESLGQHSARDQMACAMSLSQRMLSILLKDCTGNGRVGEWAVSKYPTVAEMSVWGALQLETVRLHARFLMQSKRVPVLSSYGRFAEHVRRTLFTCQNNGYLECNPIKLTFHQAGNLCYEYNHGMVIYIIKVQMPRNLHLLVDHLCH
jgi:hypothetical protein